MPMWSGRRASATHNPTAHKHSSSEPAESTVNRRRSTGPSYPRRPRPGPPVLRLIRLHAGAVRGRGPGSAEHLRPPGAGGVVDVLAAVPETVDRVAAVVG